MMMRGTRLKIPPGKSIPVYCAGVYTTSRTLAKLKVL
jgi:hypothetical protein